MTGDRRVPIASPTRPRRDRIVRAWSVVVVPIVLVAVALTIRQHVSGGGAGGGRADQRPGTVLLVSGYGGSTGALANLGAALEAAGRTTMIVSPVGDNTGDLQAQAAALDRAARAEVAGGSPSVDVVGYSAGGVVVRIWAADLGGAALARRIVTLGSPHHGTDLAQLAIGVGVDCPIACRQLATGSDLLRSLPETPGGPGWTSIWTADDDVVSPPSSAVLQGAVNVELQQVCPTARVLHAQLPTAPLTRALVAQALDGPGLGAAPGPDQCARLSGTG
jgi:triacylglycerol lipase